MPHFAQAERHALADLLHRLGPDAPTLCAGWTTNDLAAHLVIRERRLDAAPGIAVSVLAGWTQRTQNRVKAQHTYAHLIHLIRTGPPRWNPLALNVLDEAANLVEFFVHHEDVRRAQPAWEPRPLTAEMQHALWRRLRRMARLLLRHTPLTVRLVSPKHGSISNHPHRMTQVELNGLPSELVLFCYGRQAVAQLNAKSEDTNGNDILADLFQTKLGI